MLSPYRNQTPPYSLPSNIVYFHDWRYVQHGYVDWRAEDGSRPPLKPLKVDQRRAYINCKTALAGSIQAQVLGPDNKPLPGRAFADCDWINGDHVERELTWNGEADLGHDGEAPVTLSFKMRCAQLFSIAFK